MNLPTVSLCVFVHNDLPMLKATLLHEMRWVDQVYLIDMASTDGTQEFCEIFFRPGRDVYVRRPENTCPTLGFSEARNAVADLATMDWLYFTDADVIMDPAHNRQVKTALAFSRSDVVSVQTTDLKPYGDCQPHQLEAAIKHAQGRTWRHRVIIRRNSGVDFKGYIHEEPFRGEDNAAGEALISPLRRFHPDGWRKDCVRTNRYGWMLLRAWKGEPELQRYTNRWWYDEYCPKHEAMLRQQSDAYEQYVRESGQH